MGGEDRHYSDDSPSSDDFDPEELLDDDGEMSRGGGRLVAKAGLEKLATRINLQDDTSRHYQALSNPKLDKNRKHTVEVVVDRLVMKKPRQLLSKV